MVKLSKKKKVPCEPLEHSISNNIRRLLDNNLKQVISCNCVKCHKKLLAYGGVIIIEDLG